MRAPRPPAYYKSPKLRELVTTMEVVGVSPVTRNGAGLRRSGYRAWLEVLRAAAGEAAGRRVREDVDLFSVRMELRLHDPMDQGSDLDNYVKPIQDAMAEQGVFGPTAHVGSSMKGDERVDHLEVCRKRVVGQDEAGVHVEVWSLV